MMELKKLTIHNYKSLVNFELNEPNAFTVFAGPNGAGKSNIFEAIEFVSYLTRMDDNEVENMFGGRRNFHNFRKEDESTYFIHQLQEFITLYVSTDKKEDEDQPYIVKVSTGIEEMKKGVNNYWVESHLAEREHNTFFQNFLRLYINKSELNRIKYTSNERLLPDASNLESVLKRLLKDESIKEEFLEWLDLLIPGFSDIKIHSDNIGGTDTLLIYEEGTKKPFTKNLISDGTYNILALLTAVYQTNEPQFLCIEEPENGLHPYVIETLTEFFRRQCEEKGHVIWLNTHSQTLVKALKSEELVLVEKKNGETTIKQFSKDYQLHSFDMDTAWLSNVLGGGLPW